MKRTLESGRRLVVIAYDIGDDRRRAKVAATVLGFGGRIQGSVYELWLSNRQIEKMWAKVWSLVEKGDLIRCYVVCGTCERSIRSVGHTQPNEEVMFLA